MEQLGIAAKNNPSSAAKLALFAETYRQYGGINADFKAEEFKFEVLSPQPGDTVGGDIVVKFKVENMPKNGFLWFGVLPRGKEGMFWPKEVNDDKEQTVVFQEGPPGASSTTGAMAIGVVGVGIAGNAFIKNWMERGHSGKGFPGLRFSKKILDAAKIPGAHELALVENLTLKNP